MPSVEKNAETTNPGANNNTSNSATAVNSKPKRHIDPKILARTHLYKFIKHWVRSTHPTGVCDSFKEAFGDHRKIQVVMNKAEELELYELSFDNLFEQLCAEAHYWNEEIFEDASKALSVLPQIEKPGDWLKDRLALDPFLIEGILRGKSKASVTSVSKGGKTWLLLAMALCVGSGREWLGHACTRTNVLYVNLELKKNTMQDRILSVCHALQLDPVEGHSVDFWNLRGHAAPVDRMVEMITKQMRTRKYGLVVLDPAYKMLGDLKENDAGDITKFQNAVEKIATQAGAAVLTVGHAPKGDLSNRSGLDLQSGSGVWARDPDVIISFRAPSEADIKEHNFDDNMIAVELSGMREDATHPPFFASWQYPVHVRQEGTPSKFKRDSKPAKSSGPKVDKCEIVAYLEAGSMTYGDLVERMCQLGITDSTAKRRIKASLNDGVVVKENDLYRVDFAKVREIKAGQNKKS